MRHLLKSFLVSLGAAVLVVAGGSQTVLAAFQSPAAPKDGYVLDQTGTLKSEEIKELNQQLNKYREGGKAEIGVLMLSHLDNSYLEQAALETARTWGIGQKGKNNGVLLLIIKDDRKMRLEVGKGLEGELTDAYTSRIMSDRIAPNFKKGNYFAGIKGGLEGIAEVLQLNGAEEKLETLDPNNENDGAKELFIVFLIILAIVIVVLVVRKKTKFAGGKSLSSSAGSSAGTTSTTQESINDRDEDDDSDYSSSSDSSSGFSGGGGFGGGGANGSW